MIGRNQVFFLFLSVPQLMQYKVLYLLDVIRTDVGVFHSQSFNHLKVETATPRDS